NRMLLTSSDRSKVSHEGDPSHSGNWMLYKAIRGLLLCDRAEIVAGIADYVMTQNHLFRAGSAMMEERREGSAPAKVAFWAAVTRFLEIRTPRECRGVVWASRLENEMRAIAPILKELADLEITELKFTRRPDRRAVRSFVGNFWPHRKRIIRLG